MTQPTTDYRLEELLAEQVHYYRARAPEYTDTAIPEFPTGVLADAQRQLLAALDAF